MNVLVLRAASIAGSLVAALALSGCGGGSGESTTMTPPPSDGGMMPEPPAPTLAESLASADNQFTPLTAAMRTDLTTDPPSVAPTDDFRVTAISGDGANGWNVTYVKGGVEGMFHFEHGAFPDESGGPGNFHTQTDDGGRFWFFSDHSRRKDEGTEPRYRYVDEIHAQASFGQGESDRYLLVYGHRTGPAGLPTGTALFTGWMYTRSQPKDHSGGSNGSSDRINIEGPVRLIADFVAGTLEGGVSGIQFTRYDQDGNRSPREAIPTTNRFEFGNGRITGGQFMAELTGMDSGSNTLDDTVQGFEGTVNGEFYGPAAEEMGAVVSAESAAHNRALIGLIRTKRLNPRVFDGERVPLSVGVERDYPAMQVQLTDTATVTAIEGDGTGGFYVTYRVDGADQRVHMEASDYDSDPEIRNIYVNEGDNSPYVLFDMSDSFAIFRSPEFDHFNANGWVVVAYDANGDGENVRRGLMVYGNRTGVTDLPAGTASYDGRMFAFGYPSDNPDSSGQYRIRGSMTLMADFANSDVTGRIHGIETRADAASQYVSSTDELAISSGIISGNEFTADVAGSVSPGTIDADMTGQFFGPAAAEVGGVMSGEYTEPGETIVLHGFFGGKKQ